MKIKTERKPHDTWTLEGKSDLVKERHKVLASSFGENEIINIAELLLSFEEFRNITICPPTKMHYVYHEKLGYYKVISESFVERLIYNTLRFYGIKISVHKINLLYKQITLIRGVEESDIRNTRYICFENGLYDLVGKVLIPHTPDVF